MTVAELIELIYQRCGQAAPFYRPPNDVTLLVMFLGYAQNLLALLPDFTSLQRIPTTIPATGFLVDLQAIAPRYLRLRRVVLGTVVTQEETLVGGVVRPLFRTTLLSLSARPAWLSTTGTPRYYFHHGHTLLGVWPLPTSDTPLTLLTTSLPTPFDVNRLEQVPDLQESNHPFLADVGAGLLLLREGTIEGEKGLQMLAQVLPAAMLEGLMKTVGTLRSSAVTRQLSGQGAVVPTT